MNTFSESVVVYIWLVEEFEEFYKVKYFVQQGFNYQAIYMLQTKTASLTIK